MLIGQEVTVLGAGIGGLAAARALALRGARVTVLEQAPEIAEVGAGIQVSPNGARVLEALGLGGALASAGLRTEAVELWDGEAGSRVLRLEVGRLQPDAPYHFLHRADLIALLEAGAREAGVEIRLDRRIASVALGAHRPRIAFADGTEMTTGLVIGADGLHSTLRQALNGTVAPFFTHHCAWRAVIPATGPTRPVVQVFMGPGRHLVSYPLRGGSLRNIVAVEERRRWVEESWSLTDDPMTLQVAFEDFCPEVRDWLGQVERPNLWGLFRHPVARCWQASGSDEAGWGAALLGDAAHPTLPFLAQGASMALEDAWVLAECLSRAADPAAALAEYQQRRAGRCRRIVEAANRNARAYHLSGVSRTLAHAGLRAAGLLAPSRLLHRFDWLYGHDVTAQG